MCTCMWRMCMCKCILCTYMYIWYMLSFRWTYACMYKYMYMQIYTYCICTHTCICDRVGMYMSCICTCICGKWMLVWFFCVCVYILCVRRTARKSALVRMGDRVRSYGRLSVCKRETQRMGRETPILKHSLPSINNRGNDSLELPMHVNACVCVYVWHTYNYIHIKTYTCTHTIHNVHTP